MFLSNGDLAMRCYLKEIFKKEVLLDLYLIIDWIFFNQQAKSKGQQGQQKRSEASQQQKSEFGGVEVEQKK